jgi:hypothetical protein
MPLSALRMPGESEGQDDEQEIHKPIPRLNSW